MAGWLFRARRCERRAPAPGEAGNSVFGDRCLRAPGEHHVGRSASNDLGRVADGIGRGRAGGDQARDRPEEVVLDGGQASRHVRDQLRDASRGHPICPPAVHRADLLRKRFHPAEPTPKHHPGSGSGLVVWPVSNPCLGHCFPGGDQKELTDAVESPDLFSLEVVLWVVTLHLRGDSGSHRRGVEPGDGPNSGTAFGDRLPERVDVVADGRDDPHARNDHPSTGIATKALGRGHPYFRPLVSC